MTIKTRACGALLGVFLSLTLASAQARADALAETLAWRAAVASTIALFYVTNPIKADRMVFTAGGGEQVKVARIGAQWDWHENLLTLFGYQLGSYVQFDISRWQSTADSTQAGANNTIGLTPVFRFTRRFGSVTSYIDTGIGAYLFSNNRINDSNFGGNFQFGDMLGVGFQFGARRQWGLGYKYQHHSNNGIKLPNNGINFHFLTLTYQY
jgi:lipid A 3-O-deacylase